MYDTAYWIKYLFYLIHSIIYHIHTCTHTHTHIYIYIYIYIYIICIYDVVLVFGTVSGMIIGLGFSMFFLVMDLSFHQYRVWDLLWSLLSLHILIISVLCLVLSLLSGVCGIFFLCSYLFFHTSRPILVSLFYPYSLSLSLVLSLV